MSLPGGCRPARRRGSLSRCWRVCAGVACLRRSEPAVQDSGQAVAALPPPVRYSRSRGGATAPAVLVPLSSSSRWRVAGPRSGAAGGAFARQSAARLCFALIRISAIFLTGRRNTAGEAVGRTAPPGQPRSGPYPALPIRGQELLELRLRRPQLLGAELRQRL